MFVMVDVHSNTYYLQLMDMVDKDQDDIRGDKNDHIQASISFDKFPHKNEVQAKGQTLDPVVFHNSNNIYLE